MLHTFAGCLDQSLVKTVQYGQQQGILGVEVMEDRALGYPRSGGNLAGGGVVKPVGGEQAGGRLQDIRFPLFQPFPCPVPVLAGIHGMALIQERDR